MTCREVVSSTALYFQPVQKYNLILALKTNINGSIDKWVIRYLKLELYYGYVYTLCNYCSCEKYVFLPSLIGFQCLYESLHDS